MQIDIIFILSSDILREEINMFERVLKKTSLTLDYEDFQLFKKVAKINNSDASKEIRKFIEDYIKKNQQTVLKLKTS